MKREYAENIKNQLRGLRCYGELSMKKLYELGQDIVTIISYVEKSQPKDAVNLQGSNMQFVETNGILEVWLAKPKKKEMVSVFSEAKSDFESILDDYIERGDLYNLWKQV